MRQMYHLGIYGWTINLETIKRMQLLSQKNFVGKLIKDISDPSTRFMDCLIIANPSFEKDEQTAFLEYIEDGGTAILMFSPEIINFDKNQKILSVFGLCISTVHKTFSLPMQYTETYPIETLRGKKVFINSERVAKYTMFDFKEKQDEHTSVPLILSKKLFNKHIFAAKAIYGQGAVIIMSSRSLPKDRVDLLAHLLEIGGPIRENQITALENELKAHLPSIIEETFEVFDEIPLPLIVRKLELQGMNIEEVNFLLIIEELIKEGKVYARIRGETLVRY